jgi:hypothetical protein
VFMLNRAFKVDQASTFRNWEGGTWKQSSVATVVAKPFVLNCCLCSTRITTWSFVASSDYHLLFFFVDIDNTCSLSFA